MPRALLSLRSRRGGRPSVAEVIDPLSLGGKIEDLAAARGLASVAAVLFFREAATMKAFAGPIARRPEVYRAFLLRSSKQGGGRCWHEHDVLSRA